jgi:hypothetical protein
MNDSDDKWQKLVAAARRDRPEAPAPAPPADFAHRVINLKDSIIAIAKVLFWRRWSLWVALLCVAAFVALFLILRATAPETPLIETPAAPTTPSAPR